MIHLLPESVLIEPSSAEILYREEDTSFEQVFHSLSGAVGIERGLPAAYFFISSVA